MNIELDIESPVKNVVKNLALRNTLKLGPGPINVSTKVLMAMMHQPLIPISDEMFEIMDDLQRMTRYLYQTKNPLTVVCQQPSTGGNETLVVNLVDPGETMIVATGGVWGMRVADMGRRHNANVIELTRERGQVYSFKELEEQIIKHKPVALFITHGESSGGTLQPLDGLGEICHKHNCLLAVDAVVSIGVEPFFMDRWGVDAVTGGSQKGIGAPPGMCLVSVSPRAYAKILSKKQQPPNVLDLKLTADVWNCFGNPRIYHYTFCSNLLNGLRQALIDICEEGLQNIWARHRACLKVFNSRLSELGVEHFVKDEKNRFVGIACLLLPEGVHWSNFIKYAYEKHSVEVSIGIGPTSGKAVRIGFLGDNARIKNVELMLDVLEDGLRACKNVPVTNGNSVNVDVI